MELSQGDTILGGKYRVEALIGSGAFARVYRATHLKLRTLRALKVLDAETPGIGSTEYGDHRLRFELEAAKTDFYRRAVLGVPQ